MNNVNKILILAPHPDDAEFGCGASIHKWSKQGKEIVIATFSPCLKSIPQGFEKDILYKEMAASIGHLNLSEECVHHYEYPVREFPRHRQEILEDLIQLRKKLAPDLVMLPASFDIHQDHQTINKEGLRAFKGNRILGYELPWNNIESKINFHVRISAEDILAKENAAACYSSQQHRPYTQVGFFKSLATIRGVQAGNEFAEGFEMIKWRVD